MAYRLWKEFGKPRIVMYRCTRAIPLDADFAQAQRVKDFFKEIQDPQGEFRVLTQSFDTIESFEKLLLDNLQKLLFEYGEQSKTPITPEIAQVLTPKIPNNLPRRAAFFGRAKEMDVVMRALSPADRTWGVLVDGIGGIGKSALAIEAAHRAQDTSLFAAFVFVTAKQNILAPSGIRELAPAARTLDDFLNETARVLGQIGIPKLSSDEKRRALLDALRATRALLIYDNLETLSKEEQEAMADFLRELPQACKAIITSRRRGGEGAVWLRVEQLDWDAARGIIENEMARDAGLANKLRHVESRWQELYDETNGSPLALVHTLGLMRVRAALTFDGALEMLRGRGDPAWSPGVGREGSHTGLPLQQFIFQEARKELTANDKTALGALSFFVPSATFEAWRQVANLSRNALETTIDRLSALSLVDVLAGEERYALHPLTRAFVRDELLAEASVAHETGMRFAGYWLDYAERYGGYSNYKTYQLLESDWANLDATMDWLWQTPRVQGDLIGDKDTAQTLNSFEDAIWQFLWFEGRWDERVRLNKRVYEIACQTQNWFTAGWQAYRIAFIYYNRSRTEDAKLWIDRCATTWANHKSVSRQATVTWLRGLIAQQQGNYEEAEELFHEDLKMVLALGLNDYIATVLSNLGELSLVRNKYLDAEHYFQEALERTQQFSIKDLQSQVSGNLGILALVREQWTEARKWFEQELALAKEMGRQELIAQAQYGLARVHEAEGRGDLALPLAQEALKIYERLQHKDLAEVQELVERLKKVVGG